MNDDRQRTLEALETLARQYGIGDELERLAESNVWLPGAEAMLAECLAAIVLEVDPKKSLPTQR